MIHYGNCLDQTMYPQEQVDLILFDPPFWPYNQQYKQIRKENFHILNPIPTPSKEQYAEWWTQLCQILQSKLKPTGWLCYKADSWTAKLTFPITTQYFNYSNEVIWNKGRIGLGRYIRTKHEQIEVYMAQSSKKKYWKYKTIMDKKLSKWHGSSKGIAFQSIIDDVPNYNNGVLGVKPTVHINQTPKELWYKFIDYMCPIEGLVLDVTAGTGSIKLACDRLKRKYWGIELIKPKEEKTQKKLVS